MKSKELKTKATLIATFASLTLLGFFFSAGSLMNYEESINSYGRLTITETYGFPDGYASFFENPNNNGEKVIIFDQPDNGEALSGIHWLSEYYAGVSVMGFYQSGATGNYSFRINGVFSEYIRFASGDGYDVSESGNIASGIWKPNKKIPLPKMEYTSLVPKSVSEYDAMSKKMSAASECAMTLLLS